MTPLVLDKDGSEVEKSALNMSKSLESRLPRQGTKNTTKTGSTVPADMSLVMVGGIPAPDPASKGILAHCYSPSGMTGIPASRAGIPWMIRIYTR